MTIQHASPAVNGERATTTEAGRRLGQAPLGFATRQVHAGTSPSGPFNARTTPIHLSAGFVFDDFDQAHERFAGTDDGYSYTRVGNPTTAAVERRIADLESGAGALLVGSGQAAVVTAVLSLVAAGDHIVTASGIYEGTRELFRDDLARLGVDTTFVDDAHDPAAWRAAIRPETRVLFAETVANPRNQVLDIRGIAGVAHDHDLPLVVDNTLATPYLLRPLEHGADVAVHSASKFLAGHGTVLGGAIIDSGSFPWAQVAPRYPHLAEDRGPDGLTFVDRAGAGAYLEFARHIALRYGPSPSPFNAFLILQGIETLSLRVRHQSASALRIAQWLEDHDAVVSVDYSGLSSNAYHALAQTYLPDGQGSVFSFTLRGERESARAFIDALGLFSRMTHLGDVRSLALHPASTTHVHRDASERAAAGIGEGLIRLSIGLEETDDLLADLETALAAARASESLSGADVA